MHDKATSYKVFFWIAAVAIAFVLALVLLKAILLPFIVGAAVAYLLDPLCDRLEARGLGRGLAAVILNLGFFAVLAMAVVFVAPLLYQQGLEFATKLPDYWQALVTQLSHNPLTRYIMDNGLGDNWNNNNVAAYIGKAAGLISTLLGNVWSATSLIFNVISLWLITPLVVFYLLRDWNLLIARTDVLVPNRLRADVRQIARDMDKALAGYVRGQMLVCLILGVFLGCALAIAEVPYGLTIGLLSGLLSLIPYLGQLAGALIAIAVAYLSSYSYIQPLWVVGIFLVGNIVEGFFLTPRLVGRNIGLHAVWVIFALLAGATLLGFVGMLLAMPIAALLAVLIRFFIARYKRSKFYNH